MDTFVIRIGNENDRKRDLVEHFEHLAWTDDQEVSNDGHGVREMSVRDLERLCVIWMIG